MTSCVSDEWKTVIYNKKQKKTKLRKDLICCNKYNHSTDCKLCHNLYDWEPINCKYGEKCLRMNKLCPFFHIGIETKLDFLKRCITFKDSYYEKHQDKYSELFF